LDAQRESGEAWFDSMSQSAVLAASRLDALVRFEPLEKDLLGMDERTHAKLGQAPVTEIREESVRPRAGFVGEDDVTKALGEFDTLWAASRHFTSGASRAILDVTHAEPP
jgi:hypothetical protein